MNRSNKLKSKHQFAALGALLIAASLSTTASAHDSPAAPLTMAVIVDEAYGRAVVSGKYDKAIEKITAGRHRSPDTFSVQTNLCVAYAKTKETEKARAACDAAIALARTQESRATKKKHDRSLLVRTSRSNLAVALSNRGVLLAATGDAELAREDFVAAINFQTVFSKTIAANLNKLDKMRTPEA